MERLAGIPLSGSEITQPVPTAKGNQPSIQLATPVRMGDVDDTFRVRCRANLRSKIMYNNALYRILERLTRVAKNLETAAASVRIIHTYE